MSQEKKIEKVLDRVSTEDLTEYLQLLRIMKKKLPFWGRTKRIAAVLLKEYLGDISHLDLTSNLLHKPANGSIVFEDVKDGKARLFINVGKGHRVSVGDLIREIVRHSGIDGKNVGKVDMHSTYSFFEVPVQYAELVYHSMNDTKIKGITVAVEPAKKREAKKQ